MFIQGDLQVVFDALYAIGAIDPVLKMDWEKLNSEMASNPVLVNRLCDYVNACRGDKNQLIQAFQKMDEKSLSFVALEVAREFSEFQERKAIH